MTTWLGTRLGTMLGTELADFPDPGPVVLPTIAQLNPRHRYRASLAATSGGNTTSLVTEGSAGGSFNVIAGTLLAPANDALFNGRPVITFTGSQALAASHAASEFVFASSGAPFTAVLVGSAAPASFNIIANLTNNQQMSGFALTFNGSAGQTAIRLGAAGGAPTPLSSAVSGYTASTAGCLFAAWGTSNSPQWVHRHNGTQVASGAFNRAPLSDTPTSVPIIGRHVAATSWWDGKIAELILFDRALSPTEFAGLDAEIFAAYGVHA